MFSARILLVVTLVGDLQRAIRGERICEDSHAHQANPHHSVRVSTSGCYFDGYHFHEGHIHRHASFWYRCVQGSVKVQGCTYERRDEGVHMCVNFGENFHHGDYAMACLKDGFGSYRIEAYACLHGGREYSIGEEFHDRSFWYKCKKEGPKVSRKVVACMSEQRDKVPIGCYGFEGTDDVYVCEQEADVVRWRHSDRTGGKIPHCHSTETRVEKHHHQHVHLHGEVHPPIPLESFHRHKPRAGTVYQVGDCETPSGQHVPNGVHIDYGPQWVKCERGTFVNVGCVSVDNRGHTVRREYGEDQCHRGHHEQLISGLQERLDRERREQERLERERLEEERREQERIERERRERERREQERREQERREQERREQERREQERREQERQEQQRREQERREQERREQERREQERRERERVERERRERERREQERQEQERRERERQEQERRMHARRDTVIDYQEPQTHCVHNGHRFAVGSTHFDGTYTLSCIREGSTISKKVLECFDDQNRPITQEEALRRGTTYRCRFIGYVSVSVSNDPLREVKGATSSVWRIPWRQESRVDEFRSSQTSCVQYTPTPHCCQTQRHSDGQFWYNCGHHGAKVEGCVSPSGEFLAHGQTYHISKYVFRCELTNPAKHVAVGCLGDDGSVKQFGETWQSGEGSLKFEKECQRLGPASARIELTACVYDTAEEGRGTVRPGCYRRVGRYVIGCTRLANGGLSLDYTLHGFHDAAVIGLSTC